MMYDDDDDYDEYNRPYGLIYKLTLSDGRIYIGKTTQTIDARFEQHRSSAWATYPSPWHPRRRINIQEGHDYRHNSVLYTEWRRDGGRRINIEEIDVAYSREELADKERYWIRQTDAIYSGLNTTLG